MVLKPCPLCGSKVELHDHGKGTGGWMIACNCGVMKVGTVTCNILPAHSVCKEQVILEWNTRS